MSNKDLLREIQKDAVDGNSDLSTTLRQCVVLATRLAHQPLRNWAKWELNGYSEDRHVPNYRIFKGAQSFGTFFGPFGYKLDNAPLSLLGLPERVRDNYAHPQIRESVQAISAIITSNHDRDQGMMRWPWQPEACYVFDVKRYGYRDDLQLLQAWIWFPVSVFVGILDTVRNRVLDFALELENVDLGADDAAPQAAAKAEITQIFNQTIYGGTVANIGTAGDISQTFVVRNGDFEGLKARFREMGIPEPEVDDLEAAIEADKKDPKPEKGHFGKSVGKWLGQIVSKAATGVVKAAPEVITTVATKALKDYYGVP